MAARLKSIKAPHGVAAPGPKLKTRNFRQSRGMFGPACLRMVLAYFGVDMSEMLIARACNASPASGTTGTNLAKGAQRLGLKAQIIDRASFATIEKWLRRGVPVI